MYTGPMEDYLSQHRGPFPHQFLTMKVMRSDICCAVTLLSKLTNSAQNVVGGTKVILIGGLLTPRLGTSCLNVTTSTPTQAWSSVKIRA